MPRRSSGPCAGQPTLDGMPDTEEKPSGMDPAWLAAAVAEAERRAATGESFAAYDVALAVGEPTHHKHWGRLFQGLRARRLIEPVVATRSRRPSACGSLVWVWRGTAEYRSTKAGNG